jgi:acetyltransferase-like isoleucine patch superfamily enzyme
MMSNTFIHSSAIVDTKTIGEGTHVWAWVHIMPDAQIGRNCNIGEHTFIENKVIIGNDCVIKNGVAVWNGISIEDKVFIGPYVVFTNDKYPRSKESWEIHATLIKKGASIGAGAIILCGIEIGEYAMIAAGSVVTKSVAPFTLVLGNPATVKGYVCTCGRQLRKLEDNRFLCNSCSKEFIFNDHH